jgi:phosphoglycerol geranylgeranyltransferase
MSFYRQLIEAKATGRKQLAVLVDPDGMKAGHLGRLLELTGEGGIDAFFLGGSLIMNNVLDTCIAEIKAHSNVPTVLFPGSSLQISYRADALLFLSLISGRNPDLLIGKHVETAAFLKASPLEIVSTGYMLIDGGVATSVSYMSNTTPIPADKLDIAVCTAMAGELLGLKVIYMDAGSGAAKPISENTIRAVGQAISVPLIVGGGIRTPERARDNFSAGADMLVIGTAVEKNPNLLREIMAAARESS